MDAWAHDRDPADYPIESASTHFVVAEREEDGGEGRIVGFGWLDREPGEHFVSDADAEVVAVYVHPAVTREGIGSALVTGLEENAREQGVEALGLWTSLPALPFYRAQGYERVAEHSHEFAPGIEGRVVEMRSDL